MTVARHYIMQAKVGQADALAAVLSALADTIRPMSGCRSVTLFRDDADHARFVFIELWDSMDAHRAAAPSVPKPVIAPVMALLDTPPSSAWLTLLHAP